MPSHGRSVLLQATGALQRPGRSSLKAWMARGGAAASVWGAVGLLQLQAAISIFSLLTFFSENGITSW